MQRWIRANLAAAVFLLAGSTVGAGEAFTPNYDGRLLRRHQEQLRKARADELRWERARMRARARYAGTAPSAALDSRFGARKEGAGR
jgi:hypothetical protein